MKRFGVYFVLGLVFGILDWYYLDGLAHFPWGPFGNSIFVVPVIILLNYGIWLVPILPATWRETRAGFGIRSPVLSGILTWSGAIFGYYAYYTLLLSLGVLPNLENLNVFRDRYPGFWNNWLAVFRKIILNQFFEWIIIAIIGGGLIGACMYVLSQSVTHKRNPAPRS